MHPLHDAPALLRLGVGRGGLPLRQVLGEEVEGEFGLREVLYADELHPCGGFGIDGECVCTGHGSTSRARNAACTNRRKNVPTDTTQSHPLTHTNTYLFIQTNVHTEQVPVEPQALLGVLHPEHRLGEGVGRRVGGAELAGVAADDLDPVAWRIVGW